MKRKDAIEKLDEGCKKLKKQSESKKVRYFVTSVITTLAFYLGMKKMGDYAYGAGCRDGAIKMAEGVKTGYEAGILRKNYPDWDDE